MKNTLFVLFAVVFTTALAQAQSSYPPRPYYPPPYYGGSPYSYHSSTAAEGYGRGMGAVIRSMGQYNLNSSAAAINMTEARKKQLQNDKQWTETYFQMREINRQQRDAELARRRGKPEDWVRFAQAGKPKPLSASELNPVTGEIKWPILLTLPDFNAQRAELETLFAKRSYKGVLDGAEFMKAKNVVEEMAASLAKMIKEFPAGQYITAKNFLSSLSYATGQPVGG